MNTSNEDNQDTKRSQKADYKDHLIPHKVIFKGRMRQGTSMMGLIITANELWR